MELGTSIWLRTLGWRGRGIGFAFGALGVLGHAPLHFWPLGLICFAALFLRLRHISHTRPTFKAGFGTAFWHGLGYFGVGTFWVGEAFIARGAAFIPLMVPMVLALAAILAIFWAIAGGIFVRRNHGTVLSVLGLTALFTMAEILRGHLFSGFPWNLSGYIFEAGSYPSQIAHVINIYGLSMIVLFLSAVLASIMTRETRIKSAVILVVVLAGIYGYGHVRLNNVVNATVPKVNVRLVSVPFKQAEQFDPEAAFQITNQFIQLSTAAGVEDVTHIIWPEGAVNGLAMDNQGLLAAMGRDLVAADDTPPVWLLNSLRVETVQSPRTGKTGANYYNSSAAVIFDRAGTPVIASTNDKAKLVPFGEYIPGGKWLESYEFPVVSTALASLSSAPDKALMDIPGLPRVASLICYEADFPGLMPRDINNPAQLIINQTNDAWYGDSWGPAQHANIARYRAMEEGLPMIRAASNGLTAVIDPYGRIYNSISDEGASYLDTQLPQSLSVMPNVKLVTFFLSLINLLTILLYLLWRRRLGPRHT